MLFPDLIPQFPLYKEKAVNKTDHNEILTFTSRSRTRQKEVVQNSSFMHTKGYL